MRSVSSLALSTGEDKSDNTFVSLPFLFKQPEQKIRYSIALKNRDDDDSNATENRIILLTTEVECETEIPDEEIYPLPRLLLGMRFSGLFSGIQLDPRPRLLLNTERLVQSAPGSVMEGGKND